MGDRWNIHNDEIEALRYREDVSWHVRLYENLCSVVILLGALAVLGTAAIYGLSH